MVRWSGGTHRERNKGRRNITPFSESKTSLQTLSDKGQECYGDSNEVTSDRDRGKDKHVYSKVGEGDD